MKKFQDISYRYAKIMYMESCFFVRLGFLFFVFCFVFLKTLSYSLDLTGLKLAVSNRLALN